MRINLLLTPLLLMSCTSKPKQSFETVEEQRKIARENSKLVAFVYRADNKLETYEVIPNGDSTISADCPQGDGWASLTLKDVKSGQPDIKLKCSTVSLGIGCLTEADFRTRQQYQTQDGKCSSEIPFPLPKIGN